MINEGLDKRQDALVRLSGLVFFDLETRFALIRVDP
jgi:hypothetical protein